ncbi:hypothetical protein [Nannocystis pusilla]|uniref:Uncharacterized protein n=1 Tax=Nannocystis pusilla TaxID=889268 RepID=A0ABS7U396_9BACT|nr:hypothetical protein [Nannocystis pusilla]MBZ5714935.1 hypothetical protein [Nannocystis pusilla]
MSRASLSRRAGHVDPHSPGHRRARRFHFASRFAVFAVGMGVARVAAAASPPTIAWDAPPGCPDTGALTAEIARHLDTAADTDLPVDIRVQARPADGRWSVVVVIAADGRTQERTLAVESCEAAVRAAAFVIAIAVDPAGREPPPDVVPAPPAPAPPPAAKAIDPVEPAPAPVLPAVAGEEFDPLAAGAAPRPRRPRRVRGLLQVGPAVQVGMLPVDPGIAAAGGLLWPRARLTLGYTRWFAAEVRHDGARPYGADLAVHAAQLRGGPVLRAGPLELPLQVGLELGALQAAGVGGDSNYGATTLWGAASLGAGLAWAPRALQGFAALVVLAEAAVALRRPRFVFTGDLEVHQVGPAAFRGFLLVEARFP